MPPEPTDEHWLFYHYIQVSPKALPVGKALRARFLPGNIKSAPEPNRPCMSITGRFVGVAILELLVEAGIRCTLNTLTQFNQFNWFIILNTHVLNCETKSSSCGNINDWKTKIIKFIYNRSQPASNHDTYNQ
ncbi:hypothetical protein FF38_11334 [Lucilia cuprina]|uniref:Uncharacterized protein n=1 Tax=Lucilia cuprina TaxID=7375 RepID=A0A0L0C5N8_LUCCU|nr:hypothetical protein FF38_11334 [Lucilia cuprina]